MPTIMPVESFIPTTDIPTAVPSDIPAITSTLLPNEQYTIEYLRKRDYGAGRIEQVGLLYTSQTFTRYKIRFPSDGLTLYGFVNVPSGPGPFPMIVAIHGAVPLDTFTDPNFQTDGFDQFAQNGYIVFHPYLRNYPPSDNGDNFFRVGMTVDVLNLIALIKAGNGPAELFYTADRDHIGLWGYSMGGEIALRVLTVTEDVKATVLYSSLSGDEGKNAALLYQLSSDPAYQLELSMPPEQLEQISPSNFYRDITSAVQLYHGTVDSVVPISFAQETCTALQAANVDVNCKYFENEDHSFRRRVADEFTGTMFDFYKRHLSP